MRPVPLARRTVQLALAALGVSLTCAGWVAPTVVHAQWVHVSNECSACGRAVPLDCHAGQSCPHCGAYWATETSRFGTSACPAADAAPPPKSGKVAIRFGEQNANAEARYQSGTILVPVRTFEGLGASVARTSAGVIIVTANGCRITFSPGETTYTAFEEGEARVCGWPAKPFVVGGVNFVPLRASAEALGLGVSWCDGEIVLTHPADAPAEILPDTARLCAPVLSGPPSSDGLSAWMSGVRTDSVWPGYARALAAGQGMPPSPAP